MAHEIWRRSPALGQLQLQRRPPSPPDSKLKAETGERVSGQLLSSSSSARSLARPLACTRASASRPLAGAQPRKTRQFVRDQSGRIPARRSRRFDPIPFERAASRQSQTIGNVRPLARGLSSLLPPPLLLASALNPLGPVGHFGWQRKTNHQSRAARQQQQQQQQQQTSPQAHESPVMEQD